ISGNLFCDGGLFLGWKTKKDGKVKRGEALNCTQAKVGGSLFLGQAKTMSGKEVPFRAHGSVCLTGARISGFVVCSGGSFNGSEDEAALVLYGVDIGGDLNCGGGRFAGLITTKDGKPNQGLALWGDQASIGGSLLLNSKFCATGGVWFVGAKVG